MAIVHNLGIIVDLSIISKKNTLSPDRLISTHQHDLEIISIRFKWLYIVNNVFV
jgi:hypothetical protein